MMEPQDRLQKARQEAGYENAVDAARAFGWGQSTYISHENGTRGLKPTIAEKYARAFRVTPEWLLYGNKGKKAQALAAERRTVPLVGYVGAGATAHFFGDQGQLGDVPAPEGSSDETVAVEIRGDSLGALFDRWLVFYDDVHRPVTADQVGRLCVVGLLDGRILIKKIQRSRAKQGLFHLLSNTEAPILDVEIEWAAKVLNMVPQ
jgi:DNA-binding XRE family transcriptional regulator